ISAVPEPDFESVEEDTIRIVRINCHSLVIPVLRIIAGPPFTVGERSAGRTRDLRPSSTTVCRSIGGELATLRITPTGLRSDRLNLSIDVIGVARCDGDIDSANLVPGGGVDVSNTAGGVAPGPSIRVGGDRNEIQWATI